MGIAVLNENFVAYHDHGISGREIKTFRSACAKLASQACSDYDSTPSWIVNQDSGSEPSFIGGSAMVNNSLGRSSRNMKWCECH